MQDRFLIGKIFKGNELAYGVFKPSNEKDVRGKEQGGQGWGYTEQLSTDTKIWQSRSSNKKRQTSHKKRRLFNTKGGRDVALFICGVSCKTDFL